MSEYQLKIDGIDIKFPYIPYEVQKIYMSKVIECLQMGINGLLESPTGTGKTLSLLCSSLAWIKHRQIILEQAALLPNNEAKDILNVSYAFNSEIGNQSIVNGRNGPNFAFLPKIIYSSRTHSQLSQVVQELKRSSYNDAFAVVLGSRDQLCLHPEVSKLQSNSEKLNSCKSRITNHTCPFNLNLDNKLLAKDYQENPVLDIEDLITAGKKNTCCPYYAARSLKSRADIIFTPYNYLIDPKTRRIHGIEVTNNVIIFDEAHNIENVCEDSMSFQLRSSDLARCINEISQAIDYIKDIETVGQFNSGSVEFSLSDLSILKVMFCELEDQLDKAVSNLKEGSAKPASFVFDMFANVGLTPQKKDVVLDLLDKVILHLTTETVNTSWTTKGAGLQCFSDLIRIMFSKSSTLDQSLVKRFNEKYRVYLAPDDSQQNNFTFKKSTKQSWTLNYWCFSPELSMMDLTQQSVHSLILTSGTLSPLNSFATELGVSFPIKLENPHIIDENQIFVGVISQGPDGTILNSSYQNRSNIKYINSLGRTLINLGRMVPDGMLVFFPSYSVLRSSVSKWEECGIWNSLSSVKSIFIEPQGKIAFQEGITQYYEKIENPDSQGAILLAVCRGKVSEGLDFADKNARAVFITGLPFPPCQDPRVKLKMSYLNEFCKEKKGLSGSEWYLLQASRVVNQAIGRVIRHKDDYGAIIFCDNRFAEKRISSQLSMWLQGKIKVFNSFGSAMKEMTRFFQKIEQTSFSKLHQASEIFPSSCRKIFFSPISDLKSSNDDSKNKLSNDYNIIQSYLPDSTSKTSKKNMSENSKYHESIFDALEHMTTSSHSSSENSKYHESVFDLEHNATSSSQSSFIPENKKETSILNDKSKIKYDDIAMKSVKRRKINVGLHNINDEDKTEINVNHEVLLRNKWKNHLQEVKKVLNFTNNYPKFCDAVKKYKENKNVADFAKNISDLIINVPERENILNIVSKLVSSEERKCFVNLCITNFKHGKNENDIFVENDSLLQVSNKNSLKNSMLFAGKAYKCVNCKKDATVPMMAPCSHICCFLCWKNVRKKIRACPVCKATKIKNRDLRQMYFKSCLS